MKKYLISTFLLHILSSIVLPDNSYCTELLTCIANSHLNSDLENNGNLSARQSAREICTKISIFTKRNIVYIDANKTCC